MEAILGPVPVAGTDFQPFMCWANEAWLGGESPLPLKWFCASAEKKSCFSSEQREQPEQPAWLQSLVSCSVSGRTPTEGCSLVVVGFNLFVWNHEFVSQSVCFLVMNEVFGDGWGFWWWMRFHMVQCILLHLLFCWRRLCFLKHWQCLPVANGRPWGCSCHSSGSGHFGCSGCSGRSIGKPQFFNQLKRKITLKAKKIPLPIMLHLLNVVKERLEICTHHGYWAAHR